MRTKNICEVPVAETAPVANLLAEVGGELKWVPASQYPLKRADEAVVSADGWDITWTGTNPSAYIRYEIENVADLLGKKMAPLICGLISRLSRGLTRHGRFLTECGVPGSRSVETMTITPLIRLIRSRPR